MIYKWICKDKKTGEIHCVKKFETDMKLTDKQKKEICAVCGEVMKLEVDIAN